MNADRVHDADDYRGSSAAASRVVEQLRRADPGLTAHDEHAARPGPGVCQQPVETRALLFPADEHRHGS
jgi:hypothetical protein